MRSEEAFRNWKHDLCDMLKDTVEPGGPSLLSSLLQRLRQVGYVVKGQTGQQSESLSQNKSRAKEGRRCHLLVECLCAWLRVQSITRPPHPRSPKLSPRMRLQTDQWFIVCGCSVCIPIPVYRSFEIKFKVYRFRKDCLVGQIFLCSILLFQQHRDFMYVTWIWKTEKEMVSL